MDSVCCLATSTLVARPSHDLVFDCLQHIKMEKKGLRDLVIGVNVYLGERLCN